MSGVTLYGLRNCDTCRKALRALEGAGHDVSFRDVRAEPLSAGDWRALLDAVGDALVNRRSTTWRGLDPEAQAADPEHLLAAHPAVMKRPVIRHNDATYLGWTDAARAALS